MPSVSKLVNHTGFWDLLHEFATATSAYSDIAMKMRGYLFAAVPVTSRVAEILPTRKAVPCSTSDGDDGWWPFRTKTTNEYCRTRSALVTQFPVPRFFRISSTDSRVKSAIAPGIIISPDPLAPRRRRHTCK